MLTTYQLAFQRANGYSTLVAQVQHNAMDGEFCCLVDFPGGKDPETLNPRQ